MESSSSNRFAGFALVLAMALTLLVPSTGFAQAVSAADRDALVKLRTDRGGQAQEVDSLIRLANDAAGKGLPATPLTNKIREGLAKGVEPRLIENVVRQMTTQLEVADRLVRELDPSVPAASREAPVALLAEAIGGGVTESEVRDLRRVAAVPGKPLSSTTTAEGLASAAKGLSLIREAKLSASDGTAVISEAVRQGFRSAELLDLGREIKRREVDYRAGRANLQTLRESIARGERPEQLFRDRPAPVDRPAAARPEPVERPARPETPTRPEVPVRPERPERPVTPRDR